MKGWVIWLSVAILFFIVEVLSPTVFFFACLGVGALGAMVVAFITESLIIKWIVFFIVSTIAVFVSRPLAKKFSSRSARVSHIDEIVNRRIQVIEAIDPGKREGTVIVDGEKWRAEADERIESGDWVEIIKVDGTHLIVKKYKAKNE